MHTFFNALLGIRVLEDRRLPAARRVRPGAAGARVLVFVAVRDRVRPLLILLYLAVLSIALWAVFPLNDPRIWLRPHAGPRYFLFACLFILLALLHLSSAASPLRRRRPACCWGSRSPSGYPRISSSPGSPTSAGRTTSPRSGPSPPGRDFSIPVVPLYHPPHGAAQERRPSAASRRSPGSGRWRRRHRPHTPSRVRRRSTLNEPSNDHSPQRRPAGRPTARPRIPPAGSS